jgi:2-oxoglutarate dehydrogenase E2 component (dihydrolipoamide succinyltransferase)
MPVDIKVPAVGESITEGSIARWLKQDGAQVQPDEPLFELETEKATQEVPSPAAGVLHISAREGATVAIGSVVGTIEPSAARHTAGPDAAKKPAAAAPTPSPSTTTRPTPPATTPQPPAPPKAAPTAPAHVAAKAEGNNAPVSPAARRLATEEGIDVKQLAGTGRGGMILKNDVQDHLEQHKTASVAPPAADAASSKPVQTAARESRQRMSAIRLRIAERLLASQKQTASLTTFNEADMSAVTALRTRYKEQFKEKHDVGLGFMSFFVSACVQALKEYPFVNARIDDADVVFQHYYNIGVAVSTDKGLMVPVLRDADQMSFAQIEKAVAGMAVKARDGNINVADLQGGTFTITNGGTFGSMLSTPILNAPQSAILGMHAIQKRPVVRDDAVVIRPMMYLALTYDHRLIDGREAVLFLVRVKECLEDPERLLLEV